MLRVTLYTSPLPSPADAFIISGREEGEGESSRSSWNTQKRDALHLRPPFSLYLNSSPRAPVVSLACVRATDFTYRPFLTLLPRRAWDTTTKRREAKYTKSNIQDPGEGLLDLIKDMYNDGDADTRRAISQAWTKASEKAGRGDSLKDSDMDEFSKRFDRSFCKEHKG
ncbi:MAG: hypothetical protein ACPIOQ_31105 [Promethearchaeia archaeon]